MNKNNLQQILETFGFGPHEIKIYGILIEYGKLSARRISSLSHVPRVTTYQNLQKLIENGLVKKIKDEKIDMFEAVSPAILNSFIGHKVKKIEEDRFNLERMIPDLLSRYNKGMKRPNIRFYEGLGGFREIYDDILSEGADLSIIASSHKVPEYQKIIQAYKKKQEKVGIQIKALVSRTNDSDTRKVIGRANNSSKAILEDDLALDGQIIIYSDKVAITHFLGEVSHVVIENKYIAKMFRNIFKFMWIEYRKVL